LADVGKHLGLATQIRLVAELRWRILRNHLRRKNSKFDLIGLIWAGIFAGLLVLGLSVAFCWGAYTAVSTHQFAWFLLFFWSIFLFWQVFPIFAAGFGATFEFRSLLRFPLDLGAFYVIGLAYGVADFSALASISWLLALTLGTGLANPALLPATILTVISFVAMNLTLVRLLGSWLERLLARRRTRELLVGLFILLGVGFQFIQPMVTHHDAVRPTSILHLLPYLSAFPPSLAGQAISTSAEQRLGGFVIAVGGLLVYTVIFSVLLWQRLAVQYGGEELSESIAPTAGVRQRPALATQDYLQLFSPQVAAVLRKEFRYLSRNGFVLISLLIPALLVLLFTSQFAGKHPSVTRHAISPDLLFPGMMGYVIVMLMTPAYNCFAYEGRGIQSYFTAPLRFRDVLLGKNILHAGIVAFEVCLSMIVLTLRAGPPSTPVLVATIAALTFVVAGQFAIADWVSLSFPRKLEFGSMRGQRSSGVSIWVAFGIQIFLASICSLILFVGRWTSSPWLPAEAFTALAAASLGGYFATLEALDIVAEDKKEVLIDTLCR
jgi:ABC-2 type transport system permease protein